MLTMSGYADGTITWLIQVSGAARKSVASPPVTAMPLIYNGTEPTFVTVTFWTGLGLSTTSLVGKVRRYCGCDCSRPSLSPTHRSRAVSGLFALNWRVTLGSTGRPGPTTSARDLPAVLSRAT